MAGFFIVLGDEKETVLDKNGHTVLDNNGRERKKVTRSAKKILNDLCENGYYSTNLVVSKQVKKWSDTKIKVFADYFSMHKGDYIFFFLDRKIYGIGQLVNLDALQDCKSWAYKDANNPATKEVSSPLFDGIKIKNRCVCFFKPIKYYSHGIDMDEALTTFPNSFQSLRVIHNLSFIKMDDEEAEALYALLEKNEVSTKSSIDWKHPSFNDSKQKAANENILKNPNYYKFTIESISNFLRRDKNDFIPECAVEAALIDFLIKHKDSTIFGRFDYVSRQVSASPAKPVEYMEWIDVFGYRVSQVLKERNIPTSFAIDKYYVIEIKKDCLKLESNRNKKSKITPLIEDSAHQLMKYIDWVAKNYAGGKYSMVNGIIVANDFNEDFINYCKTVCVRNYNSGYRNSIPTTWSEIKLIKYTFDGNVFSFSPVYISND